ncbi:MAG TPA: tagaturonate epimerase family protein [Bacillota bacterium]|nr:tagaturonate epimerase family protein [Bacillota bacterium]
MTNKIADFCRVAAEKKNITELKALVKNDPELAVIYPESIHESGGAILFLLKTSHGKRLIVLGGNTLIFKACHGVEHLLEKITFKECRLTHENSLVIRKYFPFTNPQSLAEADLTMGFGDRLGLASPGQIRLIRDTKVKPVLAQQSMRELNLTGRTYPGVLADVVWAVFQEDYQNGYGADGDHLKTMDDIQMALGVGMTMITLDCSDYIHNLKNEELSQIDKLYAELPSEKRQALETRFLGKSIQVGALTLAFSTESLRLNGVIYQKAIDYAIKVFQELIKPAGRVDFEVSIDETLTPTDPLSHFFVALQLIEAGVKINSLAPRFCGEFQKGIDYRGDVKQFEAEYQAHEAIARHFGYKLSIHSGSDKFTVFPIIGRLSERFHVKTAGTNWLEAVRVIIRQDPKLYREMHAFALKHLDEAKKYYHISADPSRIPSLDSLSDDQLPELMNQDDARQVIHITYGLILQAKDEDGKNYLKERIYDCLNQNEDLYAECLEKHLGKHLQKLGVK